MFSKIKNLFTKKISKPPVTLYEQLGGEVVVKQLVDRFYWHMDNDPNVRECRELHGKSLESSKKKLFMFLSGWLGGPSLYIQAFGHPMMRRRHFPFKIGPRERDQWLYCMRKSLDELKLQSDIDTNLWQGFVKFAEHMRNSDT